MCEYWTHRLVQPLHQARFLAQLDTPPHLDNAVNHEHRRTQHARGSHFITDIVNMPREDPRRSKRINRAESEAEGADEGEGVDALAVRIAALEGDLEAVPEQPAANEERNEGKVTDAHKETAHLVGDRLFAVARDLPRYVMLC